MRRELLALATLEMKNGASGAGADGRERGFRPGRGRARARAQPGSISITAPSRCRCSALLLNLIFALRPYPGLRSYWHRQVTLIPLLFTHSHFSFRFQFS